MKGSYVILGRGFDHNGKFGGITEGFFESHNIRTWRYDIPHYDVMSCLQNGITYMETGVCRQHHSMNNRLILKETMLPPHFACLHSTVIKNQDLNFTLQRQGLRGSRVRGTGVRTHEACTVIMGQFEGPPGGEQTN